MMGGGLKFLAPAGRHVYRNVESLPIQALAGRHVYQLHRPNQKHIANLYRNVNVSPQRGGIYSGCIVRIKNILSNLYRC